MLRCVAMKKENLKRIVLTALFAAIAFLFTFIFKFKVSFLTFDLKDAVIAILSLVLGPLYGVLAVGIVAFLEFISISDTGPYGLIMNFISSATFSFAIGLIYKYKRTFAGAILAAVAAAFTTTAVMMVANYFITPLYMTGVSRSDVVALIPKLLLPFNLAKTTINSAATILIYKPVTSALRKVGLLNKKESVSKTYTVKSIVLYVVSLIIIVLAILFILFVLKGGFEIL